MAGLKKHFKAEAYATVHKPTQREAVPTFNDDLKLTNREAENENSTYTNFPSGYGTYAKIPQQVNFSDAKNFEDLVGEFKCSFDLVESIQLNCTTTC